MPCSASRLGKSVRKWTPRDSHRARAAATITAATVNMFKGHRIAANERAWTPTPDAFSPWQYEWNAFIGNITRW